MVPPPQEPVSPSGVATANPAGKVSVKPIPVSISGFAAGLATVKVKVVVPPTGIDADPKLLAITGGSSTATVAVAVLPIPMLEVTVTELFLVPTVTPVTFTEKVQLDPAARVAPARLTVEDPAVAVMVPPPHVPVSPFPGDVTLKPDGKVSVKAMLVRLPCAFGFRTVKLRLVVPPNGTEAAPKLLKI
jgi:hypothetical protein